MQSNFKEKMCKKGKKLSANQSRNSSPKLENKKFQSGSSGMQRVDTKKLHDKTNNFEEGDTVNKPCTVALSKDVQSNIFLNLLSQGSGISDNSSTSMGLAEVKASELAALIQSKSKLRHLQSLLKDTKELETSDEDEEYIEYIFRPRQYFLFSICQLCKVSLMLDRVSCPVCSMTYYCSQQHMVQDQQVHREFCTVLSGIATSRGGHILNNSKHLDSEKFRAYRIGIINKCECILGRQLLPYEKEVILFPRICADGKCRQWQQEKLKDCFKCGQVAYCTAYNSHLDASHIIWCKPFQLMKEIVILQEKHGRIHPVLPSKIMKHDLYKIKAIDDIFSKLYETTKDFKNQCIYAEVTQTASAPLTAWYGSMLSNTTSKQRITIHIIGAELQFECDAIQKWEAFFLHMTPQVQTLNISFIGPELISNQISAEDLSNIKLCKMCRGEKRSIKYTFENSLYHDFVEKKSFEKPDLVCFFNPGLHRITGFNLTDSWPKTIRASTAMNCPVIVTSYTQFESPLDLRRYLNGAQRRVEIIVPPTVNPFRSQRPERNFISEEIVPIIFKNFYIFILQ